MSAYRLLYGSGITQLVWGRDTGWAVEVRFLAGTKDFSLLYSVETGSGAHPAPYSIGTGGSFPGSLEAGT
jgi:hypothetical protein